MVNSQSILILLNKLETLPAIRTNQNVYIQFFRTRENSSDALLRDLFREQTYVFCSPITFGNIRVRVFLVLHLLAKIFTFRSTSKRQKLYGVDFSPLKVLFT